MSETSLKTCQKCKHYAPAFMETCTDRNQKRTYYKWGHCHCPAPAAYLNDEYEGGRCKEEDTQAEVCDCYACITIEYPNRARLPMYRKTNKYTTMRARMREAKESRRMAADVSYYPPELPEIRKRIVVENYDSGQTERHEFILYRSDRIDCYRVEVDGKLWKKRVRLSQILAGLRRALPRLRAMT